MEKPTLRKAPKQQEKSPESPKPESVQLKAVKKEVCTFNLDIITPTQQLNSRKKIKANWNYLTKIKKDQTKSVPLTVEALYRGINFFKSSRN